MPPLKPQFSETGAGVSSVDNTTFLPAFVCRTLERGDVTATCDYKQQQRRMTRAVLVFMTLRHQNVDVSRHYGNQLSVIHACSSACPRHCRLACLYSLLCSGTSYAQVVQFWSCTCGMSPQSRLLARHAHTPAFFGCRCECEDRRLFCF